MNKEIRVGMIRCDLHGFYYAVLMDQHDPLLLRERRNSAFFYMYTQYNDPQKLMVPPVSGFRIVKVWDEDKRQAKDLSDVFGGRPEVCDSFEQVSDDVDLVFIADCNGDGSDHLKLAMPGLQKGVPTFVDKPFAYTLDDAKSIVNSARKYNAPVMSLSILREVPHFTLFKNRFPEVGQPEFAVIKGGLTVFAGQIHAISLAQHLFGLGVESVECMGKNPLGYVHLDYGDKADKPCKGVMLNMDSGNSYNCSLYASVYSGRGAIHSPGIGDFEFPYGAVAILEKIKQMIDKGVSPVSEYEMLENIAVAEAARLSQKTGKAVEIKRFL